MPPTSPRTPRAGGPGSVHPALPVLTQHGANARRHRHGWLCVVVPNPPHRWGNLRQLQPSVLVAG